MMDPLDCLSPVAATEWQEVKVAPWQPTTPQQWIQYHKQNQHAAGGAPSDESILQFDDTRDSDSGLDPDSDSNSNPSYQEWDFDETKGTDVLYFPDGYNLNYDYENATARSYSGDDEGNDVTFAESGALSYTYTDDDFPTSSNLGMTSSTSGSNQDFNCYTQLDFTVLNDATPNYVTLGVSTWDSLLSNIDNINWSIYDYENSEWDLAGTDSSPPTSKEYKYIAVIGFRIVIEDESSFELRITDCLLKEKPN